MIDASLVTARVAGRTAANELADLYVSESARLNQEHGQEAAIAFFETLRDNLIAIRPLPDVERWQYVSAVLAQMHSPKMDGAHSWRFLPLYRFTGATIEQAIDSAIAEMKANGKPPEIPVTQCGSTQERLVNRERKTWDDDKGLPDRFVLVSFEDDVRQITDKAVLIGKRWVPKSQILESDADLEVGDYVETWAITKWYAEKEGLEYEEP